MGELCVPGCRYRQLYEGSQTSLADMASKQARSVTEHRQLRVELSRLLKRYFPREYQAAERSLGGPLAEAGDDVLVAYLDELLSGRNLDGGLAGLRSALVAAGYDVTTDDVDQWARAVQARGAAPEPTPGPTPPPAADPAPRPDPAPGPGPQGPPVGEWTTVGTDTPAPPPGVDALDELLRDLHAAPRVADEAADPWMDQLDDLDDLFGDEDTPPGTPDTGGPASGDASEWDDLLPTADPAPADGDEGDDPWLQLTGDTPAGDTPAGDTPSGDTPAGDTALPPGGLDDLFDGPPTTATAPTAAASTGTAATPTATAAPPAAPSGGGLDDLFDDLFDAPAAPVPATPSATAPSATAPSATAPSGGGLEQLFADAPPDPAPAAEPATPDAPGGGRTLPLPLKPEVVPTRRRSGRRKPRVQAVRADVPETAGTDAGASLDDRTRKALLASVAMPRPVFVADLATVAGSRELVEEWEAEMRDLRTGAPVRFIAGKARHRRRGSLVIPHGPLREASGEFSSSWWSQCINRDSYRGSRLYELAVLLHRVGSEVITSEFGDDLAVLRVNEERGLVGIVVQLTDQLAPGSGGRAQLDVALGTLVRERLGLVAVLAINADWEGVVSQAVVELARDGAWSPNAPVVYSTTWEWADDAGSTAKLLLGG